MEKIRDSIMLRRRIIIIIIVIEGPRRSNGLTFPKIALRTFSEIKDFLMRKKREVMKKVGTVSGKRLLERERE